jgi:DNA-binding transcriptional ArsR family regulator
VPKRPQKPRLAKAASISALEKRIDRLEKLVGNKTNAPDRPQQPRSIPSDQAALELLNALGTREGARFERDDLSGAIAYVGWVHVGDRRYAWSREVGVGDLADADKSAIARWLSAIASPARITLLRELSGRDRTSTELVAALKGASPGHVYHHLNELQSAGLLIQVRRGVYRISPPVLIPVLAALSAAVDALTGQSSGSSEPFPQTLTGRHET